MLVEFESVLHVKNLAVSAEVKILTDPEEPIAMIEPPRSDDELAGLEEPVEEEVVAEGETEAAAGVEGEEKEETQIEEK